VGSDPRPSLLPACPNCRDGYLRPLIEAINDERFVTIFTASPEQVALELNPRDATPEAATAAVQRAAWHRANARSYWREHLDREGDGPLWTRWSTPCPICGHEHTCSNGCPEDDSVHGKLRSLPLPAAPCPICASREEYEAHNTIPEPAGTRHSIIGHHSVRVRATVQNLRDWLQLDPKGAQLPREDADGDLIIWLGGNRYDLHVDREDERIMSITGGMSDRTRKWALEDRLILCCRSLPGEELEVILKWADVDNAWSPLMRGFADDLANAFPLRSNLPTQGRGDLSVLSIPLGVPAMDVQDWWRRAAPTLPGSFVGRLSAWVVDLPSERSEFTFDFWEEDRGRVEAIAERLRALFPVEAKSTPREDDGPKYLHRFHREAAERGPYACVLCGKWGEWEQLQAFNQTSSERICPKCDERWRKPTEWFYRYDEQSKRGDDPDQSLDYHDQAIRADQQAQMYHMGISASGQPAERILYELWEKSKPSDAGPSSLFHPRALNQTPKTEGPRIPARLKDLTRWRATWDLIKGEYRRGKDYSYIADWLSRSHQELKCSPDTIADICRSGDAGLLEPH
jgi:hypothetical protein